MSDPQLTVAQSALLNQEQDIKHRFFKKNKFLAAKFVDDILNCFPYGTFKTPMNDRGGDTVYRYNEEKGIFEDTGIPWIQQQLEAILGEDCKSYYYRTAVKHLQVKTYVRPEEFQPDPDYIVLKNGTLDIHTRELLPHDPVFNAKAALPLEYDPSAECPLNIEFLEDVIPGFIKFWQEWVGFHLYKTYIWHRIVVLVGEADNGKSTLLRVLNRFLGSDNVSSETLYRLSTNRFAASGLYGNLANIAADIGPDEIKHTGILKTLSGNDWITVERKGRDAFKMLNYAKMSFSCNQLPKTPDETLAFFKRFTPIIFEKIIPLDEQDPHLLDSLTTKEELSGLLNWALDGLHRALERGKLYEPETIEERKELYLAMSDPVTGFIRDCIIEDPDEYIEKRELYRQFVAYCKSKGFIPKTDVTFYKEVRANLYVSESQITIGSSRPRVFKGIRTAQPTQVSQVILHQLKQNSSNKGSINTCDTRAARAEEK